MAKEVTKKKKHWQQYLAMGFFILIGFTCGILIAKYMEQVSNSKTFSGEGIFSMIALFLGMYVAMFVQIIIHEAGHLVFGLLSGYKFSSFRIFNFMWIKEENHLKLKRLSIAGTGGQCLMTPPELVDGKIPVVLYNLGGSLMNILTALLFFLLRCALPAGSFLGTLLLFLAIIGVIFAIMNGVPLCMGAVNNDGYNAFALNRNPEAIQAFWIQLKVNEQIGKGFFLRDMPKEWFTVPSDEAMKNSMVATIGVFACNRLMNEQRFEEADKLMAHLLQIDSGIVGIHRNLLICDRMYIELITENRHEILHDILTKEQRKFMKQMKNFPSVIRTEYTYALLAEKDSAKASNYKTRFEKCAKTYPYPSDIETERELIMIADEKTSRY